MGGEKASLDWPLKKGGKKKKVARHSNLVGGACTAGRRYFREYKE